MILLKFKSAGMRQAVLLEAGINMVFTHDMSQWLGFSIDEDWLEENISWRDFGTGVRLGKLKREEKTSLVLYEADSEVTVDAFMPHMHPGGEAYLVLEGKCGMKMEHILQDR